MIRTPRFEPGELLTAAKLEREQQAHRDALRRHRRLTHTPGVLAGLWVTGGGGANAQTVDPLVLQPGYAVDDFGRELLLAGPVTLEPLLGAELSLDPLACAFVVTLRQRRRIEGGIESEHVAVDLIWPGDLREPPTVVPERFPDERAQPSPPLAVGTLRRAGANWRFTTEGRREAGVIAAAVHRDRNDAAPWLRLAEDGGDGDRVECLLPPPVGPSRVADPITALTLAREGARFHGTTQFDDTVEIGGELAFAEPDANSPATPSADLAGTPALMRRQSDGTDELRLVLATSDASFVIAAPPEPGKEPEPLLTVTGKGGVVVHGDLLIGGKVIEKPAGEPTSPVENGGDDDAADGDTSEQPEGPMNWLKAIVQAVPNNSAGFLLGFLAALALMVTFPLTTSKIAAVIAEQRAADNSNASQ